MITKKLKWVDKGIYFETKGLSHNFWFHKTSFRLHYENEYIKSSNSIEEAKKDAQEYANKIIKELIKEDYLIKLIEYVKKESLENPTVLPETLLDNFNSSL